MCSLTLARRVALVTIRMVHYDFMTVLKEKSLGGKIVQLLFTFRFGRDRRLCVLPGWQMNVNVNAVSFGQSGKRP